MIRGTEQAFKFTTPFNFEDICNIEAVWSQPHNNGSNEAPMPIRKYYNRMLEQVSVWDASTADTTKSYYVGTKYYRYNSDSDEFVASDIIPTEADIQGGLVTTWPMDVSCEKSKAYKCESSYYQYNPKTQKWDITTDAPSMDFIPTTEVGVDNLPNDSDEKRIYVYNQCYYQYNGAEWVRSNSILPIEETSYWDDGNISQYDTRKTYCALETYYKYIDGTWRAYGTDCIYPMEVCAWNGDDTSAYDKSKIYMVKELYYQYNVETDQFEKTGVREVYYRFNVEKNQWEECDAPDIVAEDIGLWVKQDAEDGKYDITKTYVCKNVYYRYNAQTSMWEGTNNMLIPVIEISEWMDADYHDPNKIYMCPTRYYQYNIEDAAWKEKTVVVKPQIIDLEYWDGLTDLDKYQIYLCGPTYYQYNSEADMWTSSPSFKMQLVKINSPSEAVDESKIYECNPIYYAYKGGIWESYQSVADAVVNDCFSPVDGDPKSFVAILTAEETMRFNEKYKGCTQATVYCDTVNRQEKSVIEYFTVYPTLTKEIFSDDIPNTTKPIRVFDAGRIIEE